MFSRARHQLSQPLAWLSFAMLVFLYALATMTIADPDLWGHVRFGLDMLRTHTLPSVDPYSFTQDVAWINHEWLSELLMGLAYATFGVAGLALLKGALAAATFLVIWTALRGAAFEARAPAVVASAIGWMPLARTLRPQLWSVLCIAVLCSILVDRARRRRWWLPLLFAAWANVHGGWIVGLGVLGAWLALEDRDVWWRIGRPATLGGACVLATLATPYGWGLWRFIYQTVHLTRPRIEEWAPLWQSGPSQWLMPIIAAGAIAWIGVRRASDRRARLAALSLLGYAGLRVVRVAPLFVEATFLLLAPLIVARWPARTLEIRSRTERTFVATVCVVLVALAAATLAISLRCIPIYEPTLSDQVVPRALESAPPGRLVLFFNWGEYALWHFGPAIRVSMDGRRETVYSDRRLAEHDGILFGTPDGLTTLATWQPEYVWLPATSTTTKEWLARNGYRIDVNTPDSFLAVRKDIPPLTAGQPGPVKRACFPQ